MTGRNGFTLLEAAVATLLMGMAIAGTLASIAQSLAAFRTARQHDTAAAVASSAMNGVLAMDTIPLRTPILGTSGEGFQWQAEAEPDAGGDLLRIRLKIRWVSEGTPRKMALETVRRREVP